MSSEEFATIVAVASVLFAVYVHFKTKDEVKVHS